MLPFGAVVLREMQISNDATALAVSEQIAEQLSLQDVASFGIFTVVKMEGNFLIARAGSCSDPGRPVRGEESGSVQAEGGELNRG